MIHHSTFALFTPTSPAMARVVLQNVCKFFEDPKKGEVHAVRDLTLTIEDREFLVLVGPSGCGKTTALRLIAGLEDLDGGTISIDGRVVNQVEPKDRDLAMVFQNYALYPHMTVYENMAFGLKLRDTPKEEIQRRVHEVAEVLELTPYLDRLPKALSGGQRQRVAVGRAIVRQPKAFLFDEPLSNLDAQMRVQTRMELSRLHRRLSATMIYVTHDQTEAMTLGQRIAVMKDGVLQQVGEPLSLYQNPTNLFVARFIGSPPVNLFTGTLRAANGSLRFVESLPGSETGTHSLACDLSSVQADRLRAHGDKPIILAVRPEATTLGKPSGHEPSAKVEIVEMLGAETLVHFRTALGHAGVARVGAQERFQVGEPVMPRIDVSNVCFFDSVNEGRI